jgi:hypothetical protein
MTNLIIIKKVSHGWRVSADSEEFCYTTLFDLLNEIPELLRDAGAVAKTVDQGREKDSIPLNLGSLYDEVKRLREERKSQEEQTTTPPSIDPTNHGQVINALRAVPPAFAPPEPASKPTKEKDVQF